MSSEKTQMVDLLSSTKNKSLTIKNFTKDGFLIDNKGEKIDDRTNIPEYEREN